MVNPDKLFGRLGNRLFQMAYIYAQVRRGVIDDIYVQDYKNFDYFGDEIRSMWNEAGDTINQVSIHVRRAGNPVNPNEPNYSDNPFYVDLMQTSYYEDAMRLFPQEDFLVFSDDIEWCKRQDMFSKCEFSEGNDEITDFNLMAGCKAHIIANSSYSWWAAYISNKKTVAPKQWYYDGNESRTTCPEAWIRI